ncbi:hypothetical protein ACUH94_01590 [Dermabacteraceae bacterium P7074]
MNTLAIRVIDTARKEIGPHEQRGNNITKYWDQMYPAWQGYRWCGTFVAWAWLQQGIDLRKIMPGARDVYYVPAVEPWTRKIGAWRTDRAQDGDLVIYGFGNKVESVNVGLVWPDEHSSDYRVIESNPYGRSSGYSISGNETRCNRCPGISAAFRVLLRPPAEALHSTYPGMCATPASRATWSLPPAVPGTPRAENAAGTRGWSITPDGLYGRNPSGFCAISVQQTPGAGQQYRPCKMGCCLVAIHQLTGERKLAWTCS